MFSKGLFICLPLITKFIWYVNFVWISLFPLIWHQSHYCGIHLFLSTHLHLLFMFWLSLTILYLDFTHKFPTVYFSLENFDMINHQKFIISLWDLAVEIFVILQYFPFLKDYPILDFDDLSTQFHYHHLYHFIMNEQK